MRLQKRGYWC